MSGEKLCRLRGAAIETSRDVYDQLARQLGFPDWFDPNLDALWDVLTTEIPGPIRVVWDDTECSQARLGKDFKRLRRVLREVAKQRADFTLEMGKQQRRK